MLEYSLASDRSENPLLEDVRKWGTWVLEEAKKEIGRFYPSQKDGSGPVGYLWARTIPCQNPSCNTEIPLVRQFWLVNKETRKISLYPDIEKRQVKFKLVGTGHDRFPRDFDPDKGTISRAIAVCPVCGSTVDGETTRSLFKNGKARERLLTVVTHREDVQGKSYRLASDSDLTVFHQAVEYLQEKRKGLMTEWGLDPVPDEPTPEGGGTGAERAFSVRNYNLNTWGELFNARQRLAAVTLVEKVREASRC
jgi:adenine-specific DNA methylase